MSNPQPRDYDRENRAIARDAQQQAKLDKAMEPKANGWKNLFPGGCGWYFTSGPYDVFPVEVHLVQETGMYYVNGAYLGALGTMPMDRFLHMFGDVKWFGPIKVPAVEQF